MNQLHVDTLFSAARNSGETLPARIRALRELASMQRSDLAPALHELWNRPRATASSRPVNWDPEAAERVVDLYIILALSQSGDLSLISQIAVRVSQAGKILQGPDSEQQNAANVIRAIGSLEPIEQLVQLAGSGSPHAAANAVRTLQLLDLPSPPTGGPITSFPNLSAPVSFTIHRLKEELETIAYLSGGNIALSQGTRDWIAAHDYDRGEVKRQDTTLARVITQEMDMLDLTYGVTQRGVVVCTFPEAAARWQKLWPAYAKTLVYEKESQKWRTVTPPV